MVIFLGSVWLQIFLSWLDTKRNYIYAFIDHSDRLHFNVTLADVSLYSPFRIKMKKNIGHLTQGVHLECMEQVWALFADS